MKEYLLIRFFLNKESVIPYNSNKVAHKNNIEASRDADELGRDMLDWMNRHPNGKVDFVWASAEGIM